MSFVASQVQMTMPTPGDMGSGSQNPYISSQEQELLKYLFSISSEFATYTSWDKIICSNINDVQRLTLSGDFQFTVTPCPTTPNASWSTVAENMCRIMFNHNAITNPTTNNLLTTTTQRAYLDVVGNICYNIAKIKAGGNSAFNSRYGAQTYFNVMLEEVERNVSIKRNTSSYKTVTQYLNDCYRYISDPAKLRQYNSDSSVDKKCCAVYYRPYFTILYIVKLLHTIDQPDDSTKPRTFFIQATCVVLLHLYMIQTCLVLSQLTPQKSEGRSKLTQIMNYEIARIVSILEMDSESYKRFYSNLNSMMTTNKNNTAKLQITARNLDFEKSNLEKAINMDLTTGQNAKLATWRLYGWIGFLITLVIIVSILLVLCFLAKSDDSKAMYGMINNGIAGTSLVATVIYLIVVAVRST